MKDHGRQHGNPPPTGGHAATEGGPGGPPTDGRPDPEVPEKAKRRQFTAEYKLKIIQEADACTSPGEVGALLRREGLYSSNLTTWRRQQQAGSLNELAPKKRGRKKSPKDPLAEEVTQLRRANEQLLERLKKAETVIEVQKKISELLSMPTQTENGVND